MRPGFLMALVALPGAASAQQPGEVALQVSAAGTAHRPADDVAETLVLAGKGDTRDAAKAALDAKLDTFRGALKAAGVPATALTVTMGSIAPDFSAPIVAVPPAQASTAIMPAAAKRPFRASANAVLKLTDPAQFPRVAEVIKAEGVEMVGQPKYSLKDDRSARAAAAADALTQARANAEQYAAAMKMHILRVTRVSDYGQNIDISQIGDFATLFDPTQRGSNEVTVRVRVWMDFAMAPL